jgi:hypothetical protein
LRGKLKMIPSRSLISISRYSSHIRKRKMVWKTELGDSEFSYEETQW